MKYMKYTQDDYCYYLQSSLQRHLIFDSRILTLTSLRQRSGHGKGKYVTLHSLLMHVSTFRERDLNVLRIHALGRISSNIQTPRQDF